MYNNIMLDISSSYLESSSPCFILPLVFADNVKRTSRVEQREGAILPGQHVCVCVCVCVCVSNVHACTCISSTVQMYGHCVSIVTYMYMYM